MSKQYVFVLIARSMRQNGAMERSIRWFWNVDVVCCDVPQNCKHSSWLAPEGIMPRSRDRREVSHGAWTFALNFQTFYKRNNICTSFQLRASEEHTSLSLFLSDSSILRFETLSYQFPINQSSLPFPFFLLTGAQKHNEWRIDFRYVLQTVPNSPSSL
jgi:hypothetical protein